MLYCATLVNNFPPATRWAGPHKREISVKGSGRSTDSAHRRGRRFSTTQWTLVLEAGDKQSPHSRRALGILCERYWHPVYSYIHYRGYDRGETEDLTQGFFAQLLEKNYLKMADRERGRFRSFLLASLKNYLADQWHRAQAQKRGGEKSRFQLDFERAESHYREPAQETTPETLFEQQWAATLLGEVLDQLRDEAAQNGSAERFDHLQGFLTGDSTGTPHKQVAQELGISEEAVRVSIHRMRRRFGKLLRDQIALTVSEPGQVDNEIRFLFAALAR